TDRNSSATIHSALPAAFRSAFIDRYLPRPVESAPVQYGSLTRRGNNSFARSATRTARPAHRRWRPSPSHTSDARFADSLPPRRHFSALPVSVLAPKLRSARPFQPGGGCLVLVYARVVARQ